MALRSLSRVGMDVGGRVACTSRRRGVGVTNNNGVAGVGVGICERAASSLVGQGQGQGQFGRSRPPSYRSGSSGSSTQLFKLVETDLMSRELTRYESRDAQPLGLHSVEDVLAELNATTAECFVTPAEAEETAPELGEPLSGAAAPDVRAAKVLAAWGQEPRLMDVPQASNAKEVLAPSADADGEGGTEKVEKLAIKRTYQPSTIKRKRKHGFLYRSKTRLGKKILKRRLEKGRTRLGI